MHIVFREQIGLDEAAAAIDLGQTPGDIVFLSFSDADLGTASIAWQQAGQPQLRLANLANLRHPLSVDIFLEKIVAHARVVIVRLLGGLDYWRYGAEEIAALCRQQNLPLALLPGDSFNDERLTALSTVSSVVLRQLGAYLREGGSENTLQALRLAGSLARLCPPPDQPPATLPACDEYQLPRLDSAPLTGPLAALVFYRSHLLAGDVAPIEALASALATRGLHARAFYVDSLKSPSSAAFATNTLRQWCPVVILNATCFSARGAGDAASPLDAAGVPVLQLILAGSTQAGWQHSTRGLSPADMAMQIILPERDSRLSTTAISFKTTSDALPALEFAPILHRPDPIQIALAADRAAGWARLAATQAAERRLAIVLSDYPGAPGASGQIGQAVGLDSFASLDSIVTLLGRHGYATGAAGLARSLQTTAAQPFLSLAGYNTLFATLPHVVRERVQRAWGDPQSDPAYIGGAFTQPYVRLGNLLLTVQPDRGFGPDRKAGYHDPDLPPRHAYIAVYLWLRRREQIHALIHLGAHGTLEWLPGKALAPGPECHPAALLRGLPVIYPFIVNNPGEAAVAKRRLGAVVLGHLTPPLRAAGSYGETLELERLIDDYAAADGLDRRRTSLLRREILDRADAAGLLDESGCSREMPEDDALARLDAFLCDVKELQIRDGLHVFGQPPATDRRAALLDGIANTSAGADPVDLMARLDASPGSEAAALLAALDGQFIEPGPAGAPSRGRVDVLPTGRNLYSLDPRATPTRAAMALAAKTAEALLRRHLQDHGDWPRSLVIDLWGSSALRTGGEDFALALILMGAAPVWDASSNQLTGVEILPLAVLDRPRVDVTLRISGLFRDAFETQIALFDLAVSRIAARDEPGDWNQLAQSARGLSGAEWRAATTRIYGAAPGAYGAGIAAQLSRDNFGSAAGLGDAYLAASAFAYGAGLEGAADLPGFTARVAGAQAFVHPQDHAEIDLLDGFEFAAFAGGFAAAAEALGASPALYQADTSRDGAPKIRLLPEEIVRLVRGKAANPAWIAGMMRHDYRGAGEISRALDGLYAFAATLPTRFDRQFELVFDATIGDPAVDAFLERANPAARRAMLSRFGAAAQRGLWQVRRNSIAARLAETA